MNGEFKKTNIIGDLVAGERVPTASPTELFRAISVGRFYCTMHHSDNGHGICRMCIFCTVFLGEIFEALIPTNFPSKTNSRRYRTL